MQLSAPQPHHCHGARRLRPALGPQGAAHAGQQVPLRDSQPGLGQKNITTEEKKTEENRDDEHQIVTRRMDEQTERHRERDAKVNGNEN
jgi:hypothetical protein